jgi:hypothetical protein
MARNIYALLVSIDHYSPPVRGLRGYVNDIQQIEILLEARARASGDVFKPRTLINAAATRRAVIEASGSI